MGAPKDYTLEQERTGLLALVMWAGNADAAARALSGGDTPIPAATLEDWKKSKADEYNRLRDRYASQLEDELVRQLRETAMEGVAVMRQAIAHARRRLDEGKDIYPHQTAAGMAKTVSTATDKLLVLTGRPSQISDQRSFEQILRSLAGKRVIQLPAAPGEPSAANDPTGEGMSEKPEAGA